MLENGSRPQAVIMVPGVFELDVNKRCANHAVNGNMSPARKVA